MTYFRFTCVAAAAALLVACGDDTTASNDGNPPDATGDVQLLTYDAFALDDTAAAAFAKKSGRDIALLQQGDAGSMTARAVLSVEEVSRKKKCSESSPAKIAPASRICCLMKAWPTRFMSARPL
mgnify:CR=1 FL=1